MASYYDTLQWYQSSRSSAVLRKTEKEIEIEMENYPSRHYNQPQRNSGIYGTDLKKFSNQTGGTKEEKSMENLREPSNIHESIDQKMNEIRRMIADMNLKQSNHSDFSSKSVSNQQSISDLESQQLFGTKSVQNHQVSLQSGNSNSYKKYNIYSALELDDRRDRGLCLWCDELFYEGHECCKKTLYVVEIDIDDEYAVSEMGPLVDGNLVEEEVSHCDNHLIVDCVQKDSSELPNSIYGDEKESWDSSEVLGMYIALQLFEELPKKIALENVGENYVILTTNFGRNKLWLDDVGCGKLMATMFMNHSPSVIEALFSLLSRLGGLQQPWIALSELPFPPPEPPPRMI